MYIKMEYIQKELESRIEQSHIIHESFLLSFKLYESSIQEFEKNILYLCMPTDFSDEVKESICGRALNFMIFCKEDCELDYLKDSNYLFLRADCLIYFLMSISLVIFFTVIITGSRNCSLCSLLMAVIRKRLISEMR